MEKGELKVVGAVYDIENGSIKWLGQHPNQEKLLKNKSKEKSEDKHK